jgi:hypothetical protein
MSSSMKLPVDASLSALMPEVVLIVSESVLVESARWRSLFSPMLVVTVVAALDDLEVSTNVV